MKPVYVLSALTLVLVSVLAVTIVKRVTGPHPSAVAVAREVSVMPGGAGAATVVCRGGGRHWTCKATDPNGGISMLPVSVGGDYSVTVHEEFGDFRSCCIR